ncbi:AsmA family protein [Nevskia sp.]|uniref:AsmA family protein n=1 Tax=Nevskia sp. TaxID=1929292 RepID=UPI0025EDD3FB|nr:AsmA family protein [Nevskia sp.]
MGKLVKIILGIVGALLLVLALAVGAFALFFDPNDFREQITAAAKKATGRDLTVGEIKLGIYPVLGANVKGVSLSNAPGFGDQPMLQVAEADVGLRLLPLVLRRELVVGKVSLSGLKANLAKDAEGKSNWDDLAKGGAEDPAKPEDPAGKGAGLKSIDIGGINIRNADVSYSDQQSGQAYKVTGLNLETGSISPGDPFDLSLAFVTTIEAQKATADVKLSTRVEYDLEAQAYSAKKLVLKLLATLPDQKADIDLSGDLSADMKKQTATADKLSLKLKAKTADGTADVALDGSVSADLANKTALAEKLTVKLKAAMKDLNADADLSVRVSAEYDKPLVRAEKLSLALKASGASLPGGKQAATFTGDAIYDGSKGTLKLATGELKAADLGLEVMLGLDGSGLNTDAPRFMGPISIKNFNPRDLMKLLDIKVETHDPETLKALALRLKFDASTNSARISDLNMKLDQSTFTGNATISNFKTKAAEFALKLDTIDADRYLPTPTVPVKAAPLTPEEKAAVNATEVPSDVLDTLNVVGSVDIGKLKLKNVAMNAVQLRINALKGQEKTIGLGAQLYGGSIASTTRITSGATPRYVESLKLTSIAAGPLLLDFTGKESMTGEGNFAMDVTTSGTTVGALKQALNGDLSFSFLNGAVKGFNLGQILRKGDAFLKGQQFNDTEPVQTDFTQLGAAAKITNGVLQSDALDAKSPLFRVDGAGKVDLVRETIDYTAKPTIVNTASGQGGKDLPDLTGIVIPIKVSGTFDQPKYSLDLKAALTQKATQGLRDQLVGDKGDKLRDKIDSQLEKKLGTQLDGNPALKGKLQDGLNSLFGKKKKPAEPAPAPADPEAAPAPAP